MNGSILVSLLGSHHNDTIRTTCSVDRRSRTVLKNVKRGDVVGIDVRQIAARHTVDDNQRTKTGRARRNTTNLDACLVVGVAGTGIGNGYTWHLALNHHRGVERTDGQKVFFAHMRDSRGKLLLVHGAIAYDHHLIKNVTSLLQGHINHLAVANLFVGSLKTYV